MEIPAPPRPTAVYVDPREHPLEVFHPAVLVPATPPPNPNPGAGDWLVPSVGCSDDSRNNDDGSEVIYVQMGPAAMHRGNQGRWCVRETVHFCTARLLLLLPKTNWLSRSAAELNYGVHFHPSTI